jgi:hypothetical protein
MELLLYDSFAEKDRQNLFKQANEMLKLHEEYAAYAKRAWPGSGMDKGYMWVNITVHDWLLRGDFDHIKTIVNCYKSRIKEAQARIAADEAIKRKQEKELERRHRREEMEQVLKAYAVVGVAPVQHSSKGKRLPGKPDWSKASIVEPAWD